MSNTFWSGLQLFRRTIDFRPEQDFPSSNPYVYLEYYLQYLWTQW